MRRSGALAAGSRVRLSIGTGRRLAAIALAACLLAAGHPVWSAGTITATARTGLQASPRAPLRLTYFIGTGAVDGTARESDRELATWALEAWQRNVDGAFTLEAAPEREADLRLYWVSNDASLYGQARRTGTGDRPQAVVVVNPDMNGLGPVMAARTTADPLLRDVIVYLTCLHELGHALGLAHTDDFADIMYTFGAGGDIVEYFDRYRRQLMRRADIESVSGLSPQDVTTIRTIFRQP